MESRPPHPPTALQEDPPPRSSSPLDVADLLGNFYDPPTGFGTWRYLPPEDLPRTAQQLLVHHSHMTEAMERHHGCPVDLEIWREFAGPGPYLREIALRRRTDGEIVQIGLVRADLIRVPPFIAEEIERGKVPLGRILIQHDPLRTVRCEQVFSLVPGIELSQRMGKAAGRPLFGRTARIRLEDQPVVDLVEIAVL